MVFASVTRSLRLLQSAKMAFGGRKCESTFKKDLGIVANATAADFERARAVLPAQGSVIAAFTSPQVRENSAVHTALKHLLMSTGTVPLTEGHKMATRYFGFALANCDTTAVPCTNNATFKRRSFSDFSVLDMIDAANTIYSGRSSPSCWRVLITARSVVTVI